MEPFLDFQEVVNGDSEEISSSSSNGFRLVPWLNWKEWESVRESLFSSSAEKVVFALKRISTWKSRGCLPIVIDVTASIIEIQQKDPYYSNEQEPPTDALCSEQLLAMLYCMAILRLVNCVVEKTRKKREISIGEAANAIGIPRKLIDVRHEGSHRDLPALQVVRDSSDKALDWLKSYYWEPQMKQIPFQSDGTADIQRDIKSKLHELAFCLKVKQSPLLGSPTMKGKHSKKHTKSSLKILVQLYSSFPSDVISVLLDFLLKALDSANLGSEEIQNTHGVLDDWRTMITRLSNKEPELLAALLQAVLEMIKNQEPEKDETAGTHQAEQLSYLFGWLVGILGRLKRCRHTDSPNKVKVPLARKSLSNSVLMQLLRKCLLASATGNKLLMDSALSLSRQLGNTSLVEKLNRLSFVCCSSSSNITEHDAHILNSKDFLAQQEESIRQATKKLELVKYRQTKGKIEKTTDEAGGSSSRWVVAKSWNPCPIGLLPNDLGSSGRLPVLDGDCNKETRLKAFETEEIQEINQCGGKREASCDIQQLDNSSFKKMKSTIEGHELDDNDVSLSECARGRLMIGGVWRIVQEEELRIIEAGIRILV